MLKRFFLVCYLISCVLNLHSQNEIWGTTIQGGVFNSGTIFKVDSNGNNLNTELSFFRYEGKHPQYSIPCECNNGKLYGLTESGGNYNYGVLFEYDPSLDQYTKLFNFKDSLGTSPRGSLICTTNGDLYGITYSGGAFNDGVLFSYDPVLNIYTKKIDFQDTLTGKNPSGSLVQLPNGMLYGVAESGGSGGLGVIFEYSIVNNILNKLKDLNNFNLEGASPNGGLTHASNGKLYGITSGGGSNAVGVLFEFDLTLNSYLKKVDFSSSTGSFPLSQLIEINGSLYGTTVSSDGSIYEYNPQTNVYSRKTSFPGSSQVSKGRSPFGKLVSANNGKIYGLTKYGGLNRDGILFEYNTLNNQFTKKFDFNSQTTGAEPLGGLLFSNGKLFGLTSVGGSNNSGVLFEYDTLTNLFSKKLDFDSSPNGSNPQNMLLNYGNGKLYGTTPKGGMYDHGTLFEFNKTTKSIRALYHFDPSSSGNSTQGALIKLPNGNLFGVNASGGLNSEGTLFEYNITSNTFSVRVNFDNITGESPAGGLVYASNGKLYGITSYGGSTGSGTLYEYNPSNNLCTKKIDFATYGPQTGNLVQASNGKIYGTRYSEIYDYVPGSNSINPIHSFVSSSGGSNANGSLVELNGFLYGVTEQGGLNSGSGVIYKVNITTNSYTKIFDFNRSTTGNRPTAPLLINPNGKLYGTTQAGGPLMIGTLFEFDPLSSSFQKKVDFNDSIGSFPSPLTFTGNSGITAVYDVNDIKGNLLFKTFPNPTKGKVTIYYSGANKNEKGSIYNSNGKLVKNFKLIDGSKQLNLSHLSNGLYLIRYENLNTKLFLYR